MKWHHIKLIIRGIRQKWFNSLIKVSGVALALVPAILIWSFVKHESSYDRQSPGSEKIFRVIRNWQENPKYESYTPVPLLPAMLATFPEIETGTRIWPLYDMELKVNDQIYREEVMLAADSSFFSTFSMELLAGDKNTILSNPSAIVISKSMAEKLFGDKNPVGQVVEFIGTGGMDKKATFTIGGIYDDFPSTSHLRGSFILPLKAFGIYNNSQHKNHQLMTYLRLKNKDDKKKIDQMFPRFMEEFYGKDYYDFARSTYLLQPVTDIHLNTSVDYNEYESPKGNYANIYVFPALAFLILLIASFNFVNLSISEGATKNKVFGIHKISGAGRFYFFSNYIIESLILTTLAFLLAVIILQIIGPVFRNFVNRDLDISFVRNPVWFAGAFVFVLIIGLINGIYPAVIYSSKSAIGYLQDKTNSLVRQSRVQRIFQILQFAICMLFISGSVVVFKQLNYINNTLSHSIDKDNVLIIKNADRLDNNQEVFKSELKKISGVSGVSLCDEVPGIAFYSHWGQPVDSAAFNAHIASFYCDYDYKATLNLHLIKGRFFQPDFRTDNNSIVLNETAVNTLGWQDNPIGKRYRLDKTYTVIGVVKDIYFDSFYHEILPQGFLLLPPNTFNRALVKINNGQTTSTMKAINRLWHQFVPDREMYYSFLNDEFTFWYQSDRKTGQLALMLAAIAIFLSALGLFAMVLQSINSRTKEIGIRKVNGAKTVEIVRLLNSSTVRWVIIAFLFVTPITWWIMQKWLEEFVYRTSLSWWIFASAGVLVLGIALITVSWQSWRAATRNPVEALRYE